MFCKKCGKEVKEEWTSCPNCGEPLPYNASGNSGEKKRTEKMRGTSNAPIILGVLGGAIGLPSALCSSMCSSAVGAMESAESASELGSFYLGGILIGSIIAIVFSCFSRKSPKLAGVMLILATLIIGILSTATFNMLGIIAAILTLIGGILALVQKKEKI